MVYDIRLLRSCMFDALHQEILDLDTGETIPVEIAPEEAAIIKHGLLIPTYSKAPICQDYLSLLECKLHIVDDRSLSVYPRFKYEQGFDDLECNFFIDKAIHFFEETDFMLLDDRNSENPKFDTSFPLFGEYYTNVSLQVAKDWCEKQGYEWFDWLEKQG